MNPSVPPSLNRADWKTLYRAAILETNKRFLPQRVSEAEEAAILRRREVKTGQSDHWTLSRSLEI